MGDIFKNSYSYKAVMIIDHDIPNDEYNNNNIDNSHTFNKSWY